jgi:hypothetical protein
VQISSQQLAELLIGLARAQLAATQGIDRLGHLRDQPAATLTELPLRILAESVRGRLEVAAVAKELERLCAREPGSPGKDLDFGAPPP